MKAVNIAKSFINADYQTRKELVTFYNSNCVSLVKPTRKYKMQMGDNWCAMFTSVVAFKLGLSKQQFPYEVSVGEQVKIAKANNTFTQNIKQVKAGDLIVFNWNGDYWPDHVGFVDSIDGDLITTIEGNFRNTVGSRTIGANHQNVFGFISLP